MQHRETSEAALDPGIGGSGAATLSTGLPGATAWLGRYRRLSKDYEGLPTTTAAWCYLALSRLMAA